MILPGFLSFVDSYRKQSKRFKKARWLWVHGKKTIGNLFLTFHFHRCSLWLKYGFLANEKAVILVNSIGATLFFGYVLIYWMFTINKRATLRQFFCALLVLGTTIGYTQFYEEDRSEAVEVTGEEGLNSIKKLSSIVFMLKTEMFPHSSAFRIPLLLSDRAVLCSALLHAIASFSNENNWNASISTDFDIFLRIDPMVYLRHADQRSVSSNSEFPRSFIIRNTIIVIFNLSVETKSTESKWRCSIFHFQLIWKLVIALAIMIWKNFI